MPERWYITGSVFFSVSRVSADPFSGITSDYASHTRTART